MCKTPHEAWEEIKKNCVGEAEIREDMLRRELAYLKKQHNDSIEAFFSKALQIREGLANCGAMLSDRQLLQQILNGLPPEYESVRSTLAYGKGVSVSDAQSALTDFEMRRKSQFENNATALVARQGYFFKGKCHICKLRGHTARFCPKNNEEDTGEEQQQPRNQQQKRSGGTENHQTGSRSAFAGMAKTVNQIVQEEMNRPVEHASLNMLRPRTREVYEMGF
jgi:hypothetical protein